MNFGEAVGTGQGGIVGIERFIILERNVIL